LDRWYVEGGLAGLRDVVSMLVVVYKREVLLVVDGTARYMFSLDKSFPLLAIHDGSFADAKKPGVITGGKSYVVMRGRLVETLAVRTYLDPELSSRLERRTIEIRESLRMKVRDGYWRGSIVTNVGPGILFVPLLYISSNHPFVLEILHKKRGEERREIRHADVLLRLYPNIEILGVEEEEEGVRIDILDEEVGRDYWILIYKDGSFRTSICIENIENFRWWEVPALVRIAAGRGELFIYGGEYE